MEIIYKKELQVNRDTVFLSIIICILTVFFFLYKTNLILQVQKVEGDTFLKNLLEIIDRDEKHLFHKQQFDFTMCNPPFYSNESELSANSSQIRNPNKRPRAKSVNTARSHESVYEDGGEVAFVKQMIDESVLIGERIK